jgi:hypothetical protein
MLKHHIIYLDDMFRTNFLSIIRIVLTFILLYKLCGLYSNKYY